MKPTSRFQYALFTVGLMLADGVCAQPDRQGWQYQLEAGVTAGQRASMDAGGDLLERTDIDDAPYIGAAANLRF